MAEAQAMLGGNPLKSHSYVCQLAREEFSGCFKVGRSWRIPRQAVLDYIQAQRIKQRRRQQQQAAAKEAS